VQAVKNSACDRLLAARQQIKVQSKRAGDIGNRLYVAIPKPRDSVRRPPCIPASVLAERVASAAGGGASTSASMTAACKTEKDLQEEHGGAGVYNADLRKGYLLEDDAWKYDIMPEILDGHNVADFIDPDIDAKLAELEREEAELEVRCTIRIIMTPDYAVHVQRLSMSSGTAAPDVATVPLLQVVWCLTMYQCNMHCT
jgi:nucleolar GTP-binding protein